MKTKKSLALILAVGLLFVFSIAASAAGPFFDGNIDDFVSGEEIAPDGAGLSAAVAATGQALAPNREFVEGNESSWNNDNEGAHKLFDGFPSTKYGSSTNDQAYRAVWKYPEAFIAGHIILCTANDSFEYARRMDDGWTLSGSNDGSSWTVIYTGKGEDVDNENYAWFTIEIPNNTTAYSYYQIQSEFGYDSDGVQYSEAELTVVPAPEPEPEPEPEPAPAVEEAAPAPVVEEAPAPVAAVVAAPAPVAPKTGVTSVAILGVFAAAGVFGAVRSRKSK